MARSAKTAKPKAELALAPKGPDMGVEEASAKFIFDHPAVDTPTSVASAWSPHKPARPTKSEGGKTFNLVSSYEPAGDQPTAIAELVKGVQAHDADQVLLGVTGSGKTFTMAKIIEATQRPALILAPNKTLAAQLYGEFKNFFPDNAVEYFVSYYDYYQPEAYVPRAPTPTSRRTHRSTSRSTACATPPPGRSWSGTTSSWWPRSPASTASGRWRPTPP